MTVDVSTEIEIARPRAEVAAFAGDPANTIAWYANIDRVEWESEPPLAVGSRFRFRARFLGRTLVYTYEVLDHVPGERQVMATTSGPFAMETTYAWADTPEGGTRMTLRNRGEPGGFFRLIGGALAPAMRRANRQDLGRLKTLLEG
jgi:hypothetical protein